MIHFLYVLIRESFIAGASLQEFPKALPLGTPSDEGVYLTVYPLSHPNTDTKYPVL